MLHSIFSHATVLASFAADFVTVIGIVLALVTLAIGYREFKDASKLSAMASMAAWQGRQDNGFIPLVIAFGDALEKETGDGKIRDKLYNYFPKDPIPVTTTSKALMTELAKITYPEIGDEVLFSKVPSTEVEYIETLSPFARAYIKHMAEGFFNHLEMVFAMWSMDEDVKKMIEEQCTHKVKAATVMAVGKGAGVASSVNPCGSIHQEIMDNGSKYYRILSANTRRVRDEFNRMAEKEARYPYISRFVSGYCHNGYKIIENGNDIGKPAALTSSLATKCFRRLYEEFRRITLTND